MSYYASIDGVIELRAGVDPEALVERIKDFAEYVESEVASSDRSVTLYIGGYEKYCEDSIYAFLEEVSTKTSSGEINYTGEDFEAHTKALAENARSSTSISSVGCSRKARPSGVTERRP